jgi:high-affinity Fe2+/Pb2+ permease
MRLILCRWLAGGGIMLVAALWFYPASTVFQQRLMLAAGLLFALLIAAQWLLVLSQTSKRLQWSFQFIFNYHWPYYRSKVVIWTVG